MNSQQNRKSMRRKHRLYPLGAVVIDTLTGNIGTVDKHWRNNDWACTVVFTKPVDGPRCHCRVPLKRLRVLSIEGCMPGWPWKCCPSPKVVRSLKIAPTAQVASPQDYAIHAVTTRIDTPDVNDETFALRMPCCPGDDSCSYTGDDSCAF